MISLKCKILIGDRLLRMLHDAEFRLRYIYEYIDVYAMRSRAKISFLRCDGCFKVFQEVMSVLMLRNFEVSAINTEQKKHPLIKKFTTLPLQIQFRCNLLDCEPFSYEHLNGKASKQETTPSFNGCSSRNECY